jgi:hypothetical protein
MQTAKFAALEIFMNNNMKTVNDIATTKKIYTLSNSTKFKINIIDYLYYKNLNLDIHNRIKKLIDIIEKQTIRTNEHLIQMMEIKNELDLAERSKCSYIDVLIDINLDEDIIYNIDDIVFDVVETANKVSILSKAFNTLINDIFI